MPMWKSGDEVGSKCLYLPGPLADFHVPEPQWSVKAELVS